MVNRPLPIRTLALAAGLAAGTNLSAGTALSADDTNALPGNQSQPVSAKASLERIESFLAVSKVVKAKAEIARLAVDSSLSLTTSERTRLAELSRLVDSRSSSISKIEMSLQRAEFAVETGDYRNAEAHAKAVIKDSKSDVADKTRAEALVAQVDRERSAIAEKIPGTIRSAVNAYDNGEYLEAKSLLEAVTRSGVELTADQKAAVDDYQMRVVQIAESRKDIFGSPAAAGMLQPGEIQPRRPEEPAATPAATPAPAPSAEQPAPAPVAEQPSAQPAVQPAATPAPAAEAAPQPPTADPVVEARKAEGSRELARANGLFDEKKYNEAQNVYRGLRDNFRDVLSADQLTQVTNNLLACQTALRATVGAQGNVLSDYTKQTGLEIQQFRAEFNNYLAKASKSLAEGDAARARDEIAAANVLLAQKRQIISETEAAELSKRSDTIKADIAAKEAQLSIDKANLTQKQLEERTRAQMADQATEKARRIRESIDRARQLQNERKYKEALQVVDQIIFLDPLNPTGLLLRDVLRDMAVYQNYWDIKNNISRTMNDLSLQNQAAMRPALNVMEYPLEWPDLSARRGDAVAFQESPENRKVLATIEGTRLPRVDFQDTSFKAALDYLRTFANLNMDVDWPSLEDKNIQQDATVSLSLTNPSFKAVLDRVLDKVSGSNIDINSRAGWTVEDGVLKIASEDRLRKQRTMVVYDVKDLLFEVRDKTNAPQFDIQSAFQAGGGGGGGGQSPIQQQNNQQGDTQRPIEDRLRDLRNILTEQVDKDGWVDNGGETGSIQTYQSNLIITNTPKNHRAIEGLLSQLRRVRNMQINVEGRFLLVSQDFYEQVGFDVDVYLNAHGNQTRFIRGQGDYAFMPSQFFSNGRYVGNNVNSSNKVDDSNQDGIPDSPFLNNGPAAPPPENFSPIGIINGSQQLASSLLNTSFAGQVRDAAPALGISGTFLDDIQVDFLVEATQADRRSVSLTAPRLTFTNGQVANVSIARQISYVSDLQPQVSQGAVAFDVTPGTVSEGVGLLVGGVILADRRYVMLDVRIQTSKYKEPFRTREVTAVVAGGGGSGGIVQSGSTGSFIELPEATVQTVETTVTVPDQGTVLLGGQRVSSEVEVEAGVPVLSKIPILNRFFSNRAMTREESTLLMLIRPNIIIQDENEERNFPGLRETLRTGG